MLLVFSSLCFHRRVVALRSLEATEPGVSCCCYGILLRGGWSNRGATESEASGQASLRQRPTSFFFLVLLFGMRGICCNDRGAPKWDLRSIGAIEGATFVAR